MHEKSNAQLNANESLVFVPEASGAVLDLLIERIERPLEINGNVVSQTVPKFTADEMALGPILERERIVVRKFRGTAANYFAFKDPGITGTYPHRNEFGAYGDTALEAAARCYVRSMRGDFARVPASLLGDGGSGRHVEFRQIGVGRYASDVRGLYDALQVDVLENAVAFSASGPFALQIEQVRSLHAIFGGVIARAGHETCVATDGPETAGDIPVLFVLDDASEATGTVLPFCGTACRDSHASGQVERTCARTSRASDFGLEPQCERCGKEIVAA
ncbi:hypothetical protein [Burkholderia sp. Ac-20365]|uniref:hypothetical protein n=1 Tax=Burkholderia sp. Ac-20365 TaxID=2703897 RepID=UPI00197C2E80|nr:hypothetical protein [Burkholderia sp. Ac-20365]MBN3761338.1 hypothetical protein [Burkholderia sp. Ac-20365]